MGDRTGNVVLALAGLLLAALLSSFVWLAQRECIARGQWHLDGGSVVQARGTICTEWRDTWWPEWLPALGREGRDG